MSSFGVSPRTYDERVLMVHGFIRAMEKFLHLSIPEDIVQFCVSFFLQREFFGLCSKSYQLSPDRTIVTKRIFKAASVFGDVFVDSMCKEVHRWTFKILQKGLICIGITNHWDYNTERRRNIIFAFR